MTLYFDIPTIPLYIYGINHLFRGNTLIVLHLIIKVSGSMLSFLKLV